MQALMAMGRSRRIQSRGREKGLTLIETLVALVVLGVGLLGVAALYLDALRGGRSALFRQQAVNLAADLGDRLRADPQVCGNPADFSACDAAWRDSVATVLPGGTGAVASAVLRAAPAGYTDPLRLYTITLSWQEPGQAAPSTYTLEVEN